MTKVSVHSVLEFLHHGTALPQLMPKDEIEIWRSPNDLPTESYGHLRELLSEEEVRRASAFRFECHRKQYIIARALLRRLLAGYLSVEPTVLQFQYTSTGKPYLSGPQLQSNIQFNLAHSGAMILLAFALHRKIGVDIEEIRSDIEINDISQRFFSPSERQWIASLPPARRSDAFFRCWTRKEAFLKGTGDGLSVGLDSFDVVPRPDEESCRLETSGCRTWLVQDLHIEPGYAAAVAIECSAH